MPERFQPSIRVDRQITFQCECARVDVNLRFSRFGETKIFINDHFGNRETIVYFCHAHFAAWVLYSELIVDLLGSSPGLGKTRKVKVRVHSSGTRADRQPHSLDRYKILVELWCEIRSGDNRRRGSIGGGTTIQ